MITIGLDTNILLRLLIDDDPIQRKAVLDFGKGIGREYMGYVTVISLVEMDWALRKQFGFTKQQSTDALRQITRIRGMDVQSFDAVDRALTGVASGDGDFADLMIAHLCLDAGCSHIVSLDKKAAAKIAAVELLA